MMMAAMEIRRATPLDASAMTAISHQAYAPFLPLLGRPPAPMLADHATHIAKDRVFLACDSAGTVLGYAIVIAADDGFWLDNIAVAPAAQGQGVGGRLVAAVEAWLAPQSERYALYTNIVMSANIEWYRRLGFVETARRRVDGFDRVYFEKYLARRMNGMSAADQK